MKNRFRAKLIWFLIATPYQFISGIMSIFWNLYFLISGDDSIQKGMQELNGHINDIIEYAIFRKNPKKRKKINREILDKFKENNKQNDERPKFDPEYLRKDGKPKD